MHDFIFENQDSLQPEALPSWANDLGLDMGKFANAIGERIAAKRIEEVWCSPKIRPVVKLAKDHWNEEWNDECAHAQAPQRRVQGAGGIQGFLRR